MTLFSLFSKKEISAQPGQKIIKKDDYEILLSAQEILQTAQKEAEEFTKKSKDKAEKLKAEEKEKGFQQGLEEFNEKLIKIEKEFAAFKKETEKKVMQIALQAAKKILGDELKTHPDRIVDIVKQALKPVLQHKKVTIFAHPDDIQHLKAQKAELQKILSQADFFSIQERPDVKPGGCIIQTESGIINAQLENQWRALEAAFNKFMNNQ